MSEFHMNGVTVLETNGVTRTDFDLASIALPQDYQNFLVVQPVLTKIGLRRPDKFEWFRVHPSSDYRCGFRMLHFEAEYYFVHQDVADLVQHEANPMVLYTAVNSQDALFLFPVRLPGADGDLDAFAQHYHRICQIAQGTWTRMTWNKHTRQHDVHKTEDIKKEPAFPDMPFKELVRLAYEGAAITTPDHHIIKHLQGKM